MFCITQFGGVAIAFVGVWVAVDERTFHLTVVSITALIQHAAYVAIVVGSCIIIISFCGCFGAATASKCLLGVVSLLSCTHRTGVSSCIEM